jgi:DNA-binding NtrC family response regulator
VLQDREIRPVGGTEAKKVDVRIIAATHRDLLAEIEAGTFREDLYYRLNVVPIHIPPLRERPEDIPALVRGFIARHSDGRKRGITNAALERLALFPWKGNGRELENLVERALALSDADELDAQDLPLAVRDGGHEGLPQGAVLADLAARELTLRELEDLYIDEVLRITKGNKVRATRLLGIDRKTLYRRLERRAGKEA